MAELDALAPNYHRAQRRWPHAPNLSEHYDGLAICFDGNQHGLIEHIKSFIESVCVTIMGEMREPMPSSRPSTTELLVAALRPLGLRNTHGAQKLDKVLSGFNRLSDSIGEMRDEAGPVAHGKDGFLDALTADHTRAFLAVGDAILGVLLNGLDGIEPDLSVTREPYENFPHLNERIDLAVNVEARVDEDDERPVVIFSVETGHQVIELRVEPSRLLYGIDREAYIEVLKTAERDAEFEEEGAETESAVEAVEPSKVPWVTAERGSRLVLVPAYSDSFEPHRPGLEGFLEAEDIKPGSTDESANRLIDSLLATVEQNVGLDWVEREPIRARLRVACKRVLVHFGTDATKATEISGLLVGWLRVQVGSRAF